MPKGCPALWRVQSAPGQHSLLPLLLLCCQLWSYTAAVVFNNRPGTGGAADSIPQLPSPNPGEAGEVRSACCKPVACTAWLG